MNDVTRYRLIGTIFLLSLAAIFLPMIFDAPAPSLQDIASTTDLNNTQTFENVDPRAEVESLIAQMEQEQQAMDQAFADSKLQEKVDGIRELVDADGYWVENGTRFGEPILLPIGDETEVFAVQLATFDEQVNARKMRERLLGNGEEAFISQYKQRGLGGEKIRYRVAVGPMLSHTLAKEKRTSYTQTYGVEAIVVAMTQ
jgi:cell division septation protein DedD